MNADQVRQIRKRLPPELTARIGRLKITFTTSTTILTRLIAQQGHRWAADMIAPEYTEQQVIKIFSTLVGAIERAA